MATTTKTKKTAEKEEVKKSGRAKAGEKTSKPAGRAKAGEKKPAVKAETKKEPAKKATTKAKAEPKKETAKKAPAKAKADSAKKALPKAVKETTKKAPAKKSTAAKKETAKAKSKEVDSLIKEVKKTEKVAVVDELVSNIVLEEEKTETAEEVETKSEEIVEEIKVEEAIEPASEEKDLPQEEASVIEDEKESPIEEEIAPVVEEAKPEEAEEVKEEIQEENVEALEKQEASPILADFGTNEEINEDFLEKEEKTKKSKQDKEPKSPAEKYRSLAKSFNLISIFFKLGLISVLGLVLYIFVYMYSAYDAISGYEEEARLMLIMVIAISSAILYYIIALFVTFICTSAIDKRRRGKFIYLISFIFGSIPTAIGSVFSLIYLSKTKNEPYEKETREQTLKRRYSVDNDIKYRGPLSYRLLRVLAWITIAVMVVITMNGISAKITKNPFFNDEGVWGTVLPLISVLSVPLFITATFATILNRSKSYKSVIVFYLAAYLAVAGGALLAYERYLDAFMQAIAKNYDTPVTPADLIGAKLQKNVFSDLLALSLFYFFYTYNPKKHFQGKNLKYFRLLALVPLLIAGASYAFKVLNTYQILKLPIEVYPFLTTKPPFIYLIFIILTIWIKARANDYYKHGGTKEEYYAYLNTNRNSFSFSLMLALILVFASLIDTALYGALSFMENGDLVVSAFEIGDCSALFVAVPIILLFSYTRCYIKNSSLDLLITLGGIAIVGLTVVECTYQIVSRLLV